MWLFVTGFPSPAGVFGFPLLAIGLGLLLLSFVSPACLLSRVRGFGFVAALAYSLYLTHKEIAHLVRVQVPQLVEAGGWLALLIYLAPCFAVATLLYLLIERPFLKLREKISARRPQPAHQGAAAG